MSQISARPRTTRDDARSPCTTRRNLRPTLNFECFLGASLTGPAGAESRQQPPPWPVWRRRRFVIVAVTDGGGSRRRRALRSLAGERKSPTDGPRREERRFDGESGRRGEVVADHDDAEARALQVSDQLGGPVWSAERPGAAVARRGIHDLRVAEQRAGDSDLLALAAEERFRHHCEAGMVTARVDSKLGGLVLHPHLVELTTKCPDPRRVQPRPRKKVGSTTSRLSQSARDMEPVEIPSATASCGLLMRIVAFEADLHVSGPGIPADRLDQRRLDGAVSPTRPTPRRRRRQIDPVQ